jgi:hypothetical protein
MQALRVLMTMYAFCLAKTKTERRIQLAVWSKNALNGAPVLVFY